MNYKLINEALKDINQLRNSHKFVQVESHETNNVDKENGSQGESNIITEVYSIGEDIYLKVLLETDSYGGNEAITSIQICVPVKKEITVFEAIN
jgi:hypothetical protein